MKGARINLYNEVAFFVFCICPHKSHELDFVSWKELSRVNTECFGIYVLIFPSSFCMERSRDYAAVHFAIDHRPSSTFLFEAHCFQNYFHIWIASSRLWCAHFSSASCNCDRKVICFFARNLLANELLRNHQISIFGVLLR